MSVNVSIGSFGRELIKVIREYESNGGEIAELELVTDRFALNSRFNSLIQLMCSKYPERAKSIRIQAKDTVASLVDAYAEQLLNGASLEYQPMESIYERVMRCVVATQSGSPLTMLSIVRSLTGESLPFSAAQNCEWMTPEMANMFSELMFVRVGWLLDGKGQPSITVPLPYMASPVNIEKLENISVMRREMFLLIKESVFDQDYLAVQRITFKNTAQAHAMPIQVFRPLARTDCPEEMSAIVDMSTKDMAVILHGHIAALDYESLVSGGEVYSEFLTKQNFQLSTPEAINDVLQGGRS